MYGFSDCILLKMSYCTCMQWETENSADVPRCTSSDFSALFKAEKCTSTWEYPHTSEVNPFKHTLTDLMNHCQLHLHTHTLARKQKCHRTGKQRNLDQCIVAYLYVTLGSFRVLSNHNTSLIVPFRCWHTTNICFWTTNVYWLLEIDGLMYTRVKYKKGSNID